ncbi:MAG TPA: copper chaperone PCu(A)C [Methylovorus sp.]|nr:copper chaperone PCu(A)C [Methylovorus sp.]
MLQLRSIALCLFLCASQGAWAAGNLDISRDWVRATAPGQDVGAAYMTLTSTEDGTLTKVESDAAGSVEIHSMTMKDGVMRMRMLETLPLKARQAVNLEPGGFHLMLFDLKEPLRAGASVTFKLHVQDSHGKQHIYTHSSPIKAAAD